MIFYLYQITNLTNGKVYVGKRHYRGSDVTRDPYFGSGAVLQAAITKHGREHFRKDVLAIVSNPSFLRDLERAVVDRAFVDRRDTYNFKVGGEGGNGRANAGRFRPDNAVRNRSQRMRSITAMRNRANRYGAAHRGRVLTPEWRAKIAATLAGRPAPPRSAEHRARLSAALMGNSNSRGKRHRDARG